MTDKEFVLSMYPQAEVMTHYIAGYCLFKLEKEEWTVTRRSNEDEVWTGLRGSIEVEMLRKLAQ